MPGQTLKAQARQVPEHRAQLLSLVLWELVHSGREEILKDFRPDSCIASTAVAIDVLNHFGFPAEPLPVRVCVYNEAMVKRIEAEGFPEGSNTTRQWNAQDGSWGVAVGYPPDDQSRSSGYIGHLTALSYHFLIDLSIDQASRPPRSIHLQPIAIRIPESFPHQDPEFTVIQNGCLLLYKARLLDTQYRKSKDWSISARRARAVAAIKDKIRRELQAVATNHHNKAPLCTATHHTEGKK